MKNANKPIAPLNAQFGGLDNELKTEYQSEYSLYQMSGLSKREYFAGLAMQGLCANSIPGSHHNTKNLIEEAVQYADELLKQLDNHG
ncbi:hypothetical protein EG346_17045 [Chryseobacterium carnipullorum]|uniref:Uncharacterized protein n=1 Tax=Chryseobacterium carnipullorum TaxID=1124835 RepID=A0A376DU64_CHRCU|nr:hypothetical protein [Chryseobacterium carnipullorum]AZA49781.1 hypothetical protein EG346_17045 [Chryseobacterium carnipullorum]AZA64673.1 hypothetical protein EG345_08075 [Chryseobacterium carnipullorum]STC95703.1 Uncharacterised protein [Chryseobacterium carnipullorum]